MAAIPAFTRVHLFKTMIFAGLLLASLSAQAGLQRGLTLNVDKLTRSYDLYVPNSKMKGLRPLVILYHGHFGSADVMTGENGKQAPYKRWLVLAEANNFLVAIPNGEKGSDDAQGWNDCRADTTTNPSSNDVKFTQQLIEAINSKYALNRSRVYATGTSNGGNMVIRLAMEDPEQFAAVAAVVASNPVKNKCKSKGKPISILFMNGTDDPLLPYYGGQVGKMESGRGEALSTPATLDYWIKHNGTDRTPMIFKFPDVDSTDKSTVTRYIYPNGKDNTEVMLYQVQGGGHTEPSRSEHYRRLYKWIVGPQNYDIEMADEVWAFFKDKIRR